MKRKVIAVIPGYEIIERLSEGRQTVVYRALRKEDASRVILKTLDTAYPSLKHLARLKNEYEILGSLREEQLIKALDLRNIGDLLVLVLEDIGGYPLTQYLKTKSTDLLSRLDLCIAITRQLAIIHRNEVIHKDINPANIVVHPETGELRIIDFSIAARFTEAGQKKTGINSLAGTLSYISPEQTGRMNRGVDYRTDFYSLGICFYEVLSGQLPFDTTDPVELVHCHLARNPAPVNERGPDIPEMLARVIHRLMAKNPEERYQSAEGAAADLDRCRKDLAAKGQIGPFPIAAMDRHQVFRIPQELYGRDTVIETLEHVFRGVCQGSRELMLISGQSGVGKSALVHEIHKSVTGQHGFLIIGKFDQFHRNTPYSPLIQAFSELVHQFLAQSGIQLEVWRRRITEALGANCAVLLEFVPELALIVGEQADVEDLSSEEADGRFLLVLKEFIGVLAAADHPLVIFLDDLQWADSSTLQLVEALMTDPTIRGLFLIYAYRETEISEKHPLRHSIERLNADKIKVYPIYLDRLKKNHVLALVADTLRRKKSEVGPLAELVYNKTQGNPFFTNEFLKSLYKEGVLFYKEEACSWSWDPAGASKMGVTENVLDFLTTRLRKLPADSQRVLTLAACIGNPFFLADLSVVAELPPVETAHALGWAIRGGMLFPLENEEKTCNAEEVAIGVPHAFEFLHDRVQQAAVQLLPLEQRGKTHLKIGRLLLSNASEEVLGEQLFDITNQFNLGAAWLEDRTERLRVARLNLLAGIRAHLATAYEPAVDFLSSGLALLPEDCWETCHGLAMALYRERAECECLSGNFQAAEALFSTALQNARTVMEKATIYNLRTELFVHLGKYMEAIEVGIEGLSLFGIEIPLEHDGLEQYSLAMFATIQAETGQRNVEDLLDIPRLEDEVIHTVMKLMVNLWNPAVNVNLNLMKLLSLYIVRLSLEHGNDELSSFGYVCYGMVLGSEYGDYEAARKFGELGIKLSHTFNNMRLQCRVSLFHGAYVLPWSRPIRKSQPLLNDAYRTGLACGDFVWASISLCHIINNSMLLGDPLDVVYRETETHMGFLTKARYQQAIEVVELVRMGIRKMQGPLSEIKTIPSETEFLIRNQKRLFLVAVFHYYQWKAQTAYLMEDFEEANRLILSAEKYLPYVFAWLTQVDHYFYNALIAVAYLEHGPENRSADLLKRATRCRDKLEAWTRSNPTNFRSRLLLVEAELARLQDCFEAAVDGYDAAFEAAREQEHLPLAALANSLAGRYFLQRHKPRIAAVYLGEACVYYEQHGSYALVEKIKQTLPHTNSAQRERQTPDIITIEDNGGFLDMSTLMKASLAISNEIHLDRLLEKLVRLVMENAGAQKGILFLKKDGQLCIEAEGHVDREEISLPGSQPLDAVENVCRGVIHYVFNTAKPLVLANATRQGEFTADPYIARNGIKSILCQPMLFRGKVTGILYLENNLISGAFSTYHLEILKLLTSEAVIAIENASLYMNLAQTTDQLRVTNVELERYNRDLELMVDNRTMELQEKNTELERTLERNFEMQQQIIHQEKMASLGTLTAGIAHEIRNPLNFVNNFAEVSIELVAELCEHFETHGDQLATEPRGFVLESLSYLAENLSRINDHGKRADRIVHAMLLHSHGNTSAKPEPTDINLLVDEYVNLAYHGTRAREAGFCLNVVTSYQPDLGLIDTVPQDLCRVFLNIVDNACYAMLSRMKNDLVGYSPILNVETRDLGKNVQILIRDNGGGIPSEIKDHVFNPFFTTKPSGGGTGLGLSISYDIVVKQHQGHIAVISDEKSTEFRITLQKTLYKPTIFTREETNENSAESQKLSGP